MASDGPSDSTEQEKPGSALSVVRDPDPRSLEENRDTGLFNDSVHNFSWAEIGVTVTSREGSKNRKAILSSCQGIVYPGEMLAIMGPSGSGKTTLLNSIAHRPASAKAHVEGQTHVNGKQVPLQTLQQLSSYVEQEDSLIGSLTVKETVRFAADLSMPRHMTSAERMQRVRSLIASFGLEKQLDTIVGTPIRKGLSGGQKKRLGVVSRLVTNPKILFLDEPTSGLDSALSFEVMAYIKSLAKQYRIIVIASIHQPSTSTFNLFDKLCLLALGETCYFGPTAAAAPYFAALGYDLPVSVNPAEFYLELINTDLAQPDDATSARVNHITHAWSSSALVLELKKSIHDSLDGHTDDVTELGSSDRPGSLAAAWVLMRRLFIKARRDVVAYGMRLVMYLGLAILMGTVFLRLGSGQEYIQPFISAIFFGSAFMSFMSVAYVPAFLEDLHAFHKERANGLVGPTAFVVSNTLVGLPFLLGIASTFTLVAYFLIGFRENATAFFVFLAWLFLDLVAAEAMVVLISVIFPTFVIALAVTAFANGLWMCVSGFLVPTSILNPFWKYVFHYIDYQAYVFQGMMVNEFHARSYNCQSLPDGSFQCMYPPDPQNPGTVAGDSVLKYWKINTSPSNQWPWVGYVLAIIVGFRLLAWLLLWSGKR